MSSNMTIERTGDRTRVFLFHGAALIVAICLSYLLGRALESLFHDSWLYWAVWIPASFALGWYGAEMADRIAHGRNQR